MYLSRIHAACRAWLAALMVPLMTALAWAAQAEDVAYDARIEAGHSAMWYDPARSGIC